MTHHFNMNKKEYQTIKTAANEIDGFLNTGYEIVMKKRSIFNQGWTETLLVNKKNMNIIKVYYNPQQGLIEIFKNGTKVKTVDYEKVY